MWTLPQSLMELEKMLDGTYTRHLGMALDVSWTEHMTNTELYGDLVKVSQKI